MNFFVKELDNGSVLTAYIPDYSKEMPHLDKRPAVLVLPGGAYKFCSDREAEPMALAFAGKGYAAFILRYSVDKDAESFEVPFKQAQEALKMIMDNADEWRVDKEKIAAIGFSAGGHLCAALSSMSEIKPAASILLYPCILSSIGKILNFEIPSVDEYVDSTASPCFIVSAAEDDCVPIENSLAYAAALNKHSVPFEIHIFEKGYHGFSLADNVVYSEKAHIEYLADLKCWFDMCIKWLSKRFDF